MTVSEFTSLSKMKPICGSDTEMEQGAMPRIFAVIVTYEPSEILLLRLLQALSPQITGGIVINNGIELPLSEGHLSQAGYSVIHLQANMGMATALNRGFLWAQSQNAEFVITFDQDSEPAPDMVLRLMKAYHDQVAAGQKVGAIGPQQIDHRSGRLAAFIAPISGLRSQVTPSIGQVVEVDHLITSGCLVPINAWKEAGSFLDALFIDYVDIEWCLRLRHQGWHIFGVGGANLSHTMGVEIKHFFGWQIPIHKPQRYYYIFRNGIHLQKLSHIPIGWKLADMIYLFKRLIFFSVVSRPRLTHLRAMLRGIRDGWSDHLGPLTNEI